MSGLASTLWHVRADLSSAVDYTHDQLKDWLWKARGRTRHEDATTPTPLSTASGVPQRASASKARNPMLVQTVRKIADLMTDEDDYLRRRPLAS